MDLDRPSHNWTLQKLINEHDALLLVNNLIEIIINFRCRINQGGKRPKSTDDLF